MSQQELLIHAVTALQEHGIAYMLTGSIVSSLQGEPRASHDIDLVVELKYGQVAGLLKAFPSPRYYLSDDAIRQAIMHQQMFNVLDCETGDKIDFWMLTDRGFDAARFARRRQELCFGNPVYVSTPEDTILQKLYWAKESGGSSKQWNDASSIVSVQGPTLDLDHMRYWASVLDIDDDLTRLMGGVS